MVRHRVYRSPVPEDLRDERYQEELSGPVIVYPAREVLRPESRAGGMFVTVRRGSGACLYISKELERVFDCYEFAELELDRVAGCLTIRADTTGTGWALLRNRKHGLMLGSMKLSERLLARVVEPGRYPARIVDGAVVVDLRRSK